MPERDAEEEERQRKLAETLGELNIPLFDVDKPLDFSAYRTRFLPVCMVAADSLLPTPDEIRIIESLCKKLASDHMPNDFDSVSMTARGANTFILKKWEDGWAFRRMRGEISNIWFPSEHVALQELFENI